MKKNIVILIYLMLLHYAAGAQSNTPPQNSGGGEYVIQNTECISPQQRAAINQMLDQNRQMLKQQGILTTKTSVAPKFKWPLKQVSTYNAVYKYYYGISNYIDHNPAFPNLVQDWHCGTRTYDTQSGYNHAGTDIFLWPFPWLMLQRQQVKIVAAAPGIIIGKSDGNFDKNCAFNSLNWNAVYIQHADGSVAWYGHMKKNSLTTKNIGDAVIEGEVIGKVGSSGNSTGPHLHFEVYDSNNSLVDPWKGSCNNISSSWWKSQKPYYESKCNAILTQSAPTVYPACPGVETTNESNHFIPNSTIYFHSYFHDQKSGQVVNYNVFYPNGTIWQSWSNTFSTYYSASWWYWTWVLPANPPFGTWNYQVIYQGDTLNYAFTVAASLDEETQLRPISEGNDETPLDIYPNPSHGNYMLNITTEENAALTLSVYNIVGEKVFFRNDEVIGGENQLEILLEKQPPGIYILQCQLPGKTFTRKLIIQ